MEALDTDTTHAIWAAIVVAGFIMQLAAIAACLFTAARLNGFFSGPKRKGVKS